MLPQHEESTGQQHRDSAGPGHLAQAFVGGVLEVIGGQRVRLRREFRTATVAQLVGVKLDGQSERCREIEQLADLGR